MVMDLMDRNGLADADALVYIQVTRGTAPRAHPFPSPAVPPSLYVSAAPFALPASVQEDGVGVATLSDFRWSRCDIKTISLQANVLAIQHAKEQGAREAVFMRDGVVTEGTHTNFMGVVDGVVRTHPVTNHILAGITRAVVLELCAREGIPCREAALAETELPALEEAFVTATTFEVAPVVSLNARPVGDARPGPITRRLQGLFRHRLEAYATVGTSHQP
jgi:D-alanine transaminase